MKSFRLILALGLAAGLLAWAAPTAFAQASGYGVKLISASDSATYRLTEEAVPVQITLQRFNSALAMRDAQQLQAVGVKRVNAKRWMRFFKNNPQATIRDHCPVSDLFIEDDTANWTCTETATILSEGRPRSFVHVIHFTFAKVDGTWMIADRR